MTGIRRSEPTPVRLDGVVIGHWPVVEPADLVAFTVEWLLTADSLYRDAAPFLNFAEGPVDRLRRMARVALLGKPVNVEDVLTAYLRTYGAPAQDR